MHSCMIVVEEIAELEQRLKSKKATLARVLEDAGINRSTWTRWRSGIVRPRLDTWLAAKAAAEKALSAQDAAA